MWIKRPGARVQPGACGGPLHTVNTGWSGDAAGGYGGDCGRGVRGRAGRRRERIVNLLLRIAIPDPLRDRVNPFSTNPWRAPHVERLWTALRQPCTPAKQKQDSILERISDLRGKGEERG